MGNQKKIGNNYEKKLCELLYTKGYWCHLFEYSKNGQPCDVIAIKGDVSMLIDVKHCCKDLFTFDRIEPNQRTCFNYAMNICKIKRLGFVIYFKSEEKFKWLNFKVLKTLEEKGKKSIRKEDLPDFEFMLDTIIGEQNDKSNK